MTASTSDLVSDAGDGLHLLTIPDPDAVMARPGTVLLEPRQAWRRRPADFVVDPSGKHDVAVLRMEQPHERHGVYAAGLRDALVFGHHHLHAFITRGDRFDCQDIDNYRRRLGYHVDNHPGRTLPMPQIARIGDGFSIDYGPLRAAKPVAVDGAVVFATPTEPLNWGMWLLQALPIAADFARNRTGDSLLIYADRPWQRRLLAAVGVAERQIVHQELGHTYRCASIRVTQYTQVDLVPTPADRELFLQVRRSVASAAPVRPKRRIFLSRRSISRDAKGYRALLNEDELIARVAELGFEIHEPETLGFSEQVRLFQESDIVVGLGGAALFNTVFCEPGSRIVSIESSTIFVHNHAMLFGSLGHRFGFILGTQDASDPEPIHKRWTVDVDAVVATLGHL